MSENGKGIIWVILGVVILFVLMFAGIFVSNYNKLVSFNETIDGQWAQVENVLKRRFDLIPNLVETVKGYAKHEKQLLTDVTEARAKVGAAQTVNDKIKSNTALDGVLSRLMVVVENYPNLKANENFLKLQDELAGTENRIAVERKNYNNAVKEYNILVQRFPANIIASFTNFKKRDVYFEAGEAAKEAPKVAF